MQIKSVNKLHKKILNLYRKKLKNKFKAVSKDPQGILDFFVLYLNYLRDITIFSKDKINLSADQSIVSLCTAVSEYEAYKNCFTNYFTVSDTGVVVQKDNSKSKEQVGEEFKTEKMQHWKNFWEIVSSCSPSWIN